MQSKGETLRSYIQRWSIIKNSTEDVSDERAVDAFSAGLRRSDLVEEFGRTRSKTVSELMEIANRFADGEDAYNNKRARSLEVDRASRQMRRSRNEDNRTRRNQVAVGYRRRREQRVPRQKQSGKRKAEVFRTIGGGHAPWTLTHPLYVLRWEEGFQSPDERLQNIPKITRRFGVKPRSTSRRSRISSTT
jgi:hypothetical protein